MISVTIRDNGFSIFGHAQYDEYGKDIVCSAVSFLAQVVAEELKQYDEVRVHKEPGMMDVVVPRQPDTKSRVLLELFENGVAVLAVQYPKNVQIKII
jgi:uncharacterized protein